MADYTKTKVIDIETGKAVKNVDNLTGSFVPLKKQIKDLTEEMSRLTAGTEEYEQAAVKLANLRQKQVEIAEAAKYSNKDFGQVMSNLTSVSLGLAGGINAVSASMAMMGGDSKEIQESLGKIQLIMAAIQGFSALDKAIKSFKGLVNVFGGVSDEAAQAAESVSGLQKDMSSMGAKTVKVKVDTGKAVADVETVKKEIDSISDTTVEMDVDAGKAVAETETVRAELDSITDKDVTLSVDGEEATAEIETVRTELETIPDEKVIDVDSDGVEVATERVTDLGTADEKTTKKAAALGTANKNLSKTSKGVTGGLKAITSGLKSATKAMIQFIASNPILAAIAAVLAAIAAGISFLNKKLDEGGRVAKEEANILSEVNSQYQEQNIRLNVLINTAKSHNSTLAEKKKAVEELNKIVPDYNAHIDENTGALIANNQALEKYLANLKQKLLLEAYEGKIKEKLEEQLELEEEINDLRATGWFFVGTRIANRREEIRELDDDIDRLYKKIGGLDISMALDDNKVKTTKNNIKKTLKAIVDAVKEAKKYATDFWNVFYSGSVNRAMFSKMVSNLKKFQMEIASTLQKYDLTQVITEHLGGGRYKLVGYESAQMFTEGFKDFLKNGSNSDYSEMLSAGFNINDIFTPETIDRMKSIEKEAKQYGATLDVLIKQYKNLAQQQGGTLTDEQTRDYEKRKKFIEERYNALNTEYEGYSKILDIVKDYSNSQIDVYNKTLAADMETGRFSKQLAIESRYLKEVKENNPWAESNKSIAMQESELQSLKDLNDTLKGRFELMKAATRENGMFSEEMKSISNQILENERQIAQQELALDVEKYNRRVEEAVRYYENIDRIAADRKNKVATEGGSEGSITVKQTEIELEAIRQKLDQLKVMYDEGLISEAEYYSKSLELKAAFVDTSKKLDEDRLQSVATTMGNIVNIYQMVSDSVTSILTEMMDGMDENSEEYKKIAVAQATIQTLGGSLAAFMSAFTSIPFFPLNAIIAALLAASTTAVGIAQIAKIKRGSDPSGTSMTNVAANTGQGVYETTAYAQQTELMGTVADQRVYVTENDISTAQHNVMVREQDTTY